MKGCAGIFGQIERCLSFVFELAAIFLVGGERSSCKAIMLPHSCEIRKLGLAVYCKAALMPLKILIEAAIKIGQSLLTLQTTEEGSWQWFTVEIFKLWMYEVPPRSKLKPDVAMPDKRPIILLEDGGCS
ncbi:hypothetical protein CEXT_798931 [Caerostris extrusa]|uniref:Uncharacterized protein n=1 Tax=Caerostris extrusa TaxID=172846 RepID=A0AAV4MKN9_CAEEX|nr:hypothetical protein CEXT_798931 [Caerostris extrusa]